MATWSTPSSPAVGTQGAASWADTVTADLALLASPADFYAYYNTSAAIAAGANYPYASLGTIVEDSLSGWNATNNNYVCKSPGLYLIIMQAQASAANANTTEFFYNGSLWISAPFPATAATNTGTTLTIVKRLALNDTVAQQASNAYTTHSSARMNFMQLTQLSWV